MLIKSVTTIDLSLAPIVNKEIAVDGGTVTITQLTPGAVVRMSLNEVDAQGPSFSTTGKLESCAQRIEKVFLSALQQAGTVEITVHDANLELRPFSSATRKPGAVLVAHVQSGADITGNLYSPAGLQLNDGSVVATSGGGAAYNDHSDALGLEGFHIKANLNAGASLNKHVFFNHMPGAFVRNLFSPGSVVGREVFTQNFGKVRLRDRVVQTLANKTNSGARRAFFGYGGLGTNHPFGIGFYADRGLGHARWLAYFANNDALDATTYFSLDTGQNATVPNTLELVIGGNGFVPFAEWWINGVRVASFTGQVLLATPLIFGDVKLCATYAASCGSALAGDGTESSLWTMLGDGLTYETEQP